MLAYVGQRLHSPTRPSICHFSARSFWRLPSRCSALLEQGIGGVYTPVPPAGPARSEELLRLAGVGDLIIKSAAILLVGRSRRSPGRAGFGVVRRRLLARLVFEAAYGLSPQAGRLGMARLALEDRLGLARRLAEAAAANGVTELLERQLDGLTRAQLVEPGLGWLVRGIEIDDRLIGDPRLVPGLLAECGIAVGAELADLLGVEEPVDFAIFSRPGNRG